MATNGVGPVLCCCDEARAVIEVIREQHREATVIDRGSYLRVSVPGYCRLERSRVEKKLGRPFPLPRALEAIMPSFAGRIIFKEDGVTWQT